MDGSSPMTGDRFVQKPDEFLAGVLRGENARRISALSPEVAGS
jgi:hypothetical protein